MSFVVILITINNEIDHIDFYVYMSINTCRLLFRDYQRGPRMHLPGVKIGAKGLPMPRSAPVTIAIFGLIYKL